jgi:hypothetical protein
VAQRRNPSRVDWEQASAEIQRELPRKYRAFASRPQGDFRLFQRRQWLAYMISERSLGRLDEDSVLPFVADQAIVAVKELGPGVVLYGIHKKGASLLEDLVARNPVIGGRTIVYNDEVTSKIVRNRDVLIIDDSIHTGEIAKEHISRLRGEGAKRLCIFSVVGSRAGLSAVKKLNVPVKCVMEVTEDLFPVAFGLLMVPMLGLFRNGALSNRPHRSFRIDTGSMEPQVAAQKCLKVLAKLDCFNRLSEAPAVDGRKAVVYHGTCDLSASVFHQLRSRFKPHGGIDQAKFRVFLSRIDGAFHLCICAIVWPIGASSQSSKEIRRATEDAASWLLDAAQTSLKKGLAGTGFHSTRTGSGLSTSSTAFKRPGD